MRLQWLTIDRIRVCSAVFICMYVIVTKQLKMSSHISRKYTRNYKKRKTEQSSSQQEFKKPKTKFKRVNYPLDINHPLLMYKSTDYVQA